MSEVDDRISAALRRMRDRQAKGRDQSVALPDWYAQRDNSYFCGLIARQIRQRAHTRGQTDAARNEALAIADMIETGDFDWLV